MWAYDDSGATAVRDTGPVSASRNRQRLDRASKNILWHELCADMAAMRRNQLRSGRSTVALGDAQVVCVSHRRANLSGNFDAVACARVACSLIGYEARAVTAGEPRALGALA